MLFRRTSKNEEHLECGMQPFFRTPRRDGAVRPAPALHGDGEPRSRRGHAGSGLSTHGDVPSTHNTRGGKGGSRGGRGRGRRAGGGVHRASGAWSGEGRSH
eukprot:2286343-Prymnesium_polylepis.1